MVGAAAVTACRSDSAGWPNLRSPRMGERSSDPHPCPEPGTFAFHAGWKGETAELGGSKTELKILWIFMGGGGGIAAGQMVPRVQRWQNLLQTARKDASDFTL